MAEPMQGNASVKAKRISARTAANMNMVNSMAPSENATLLAAAKYANLRNGKAATTACFTQQLAS